MKGELRRNFVFHRILVILISVLGITDSLAQEITDTIRQPTQINLDSLEMRRQFIRDSCWPVNSL